MDVDEEAEPTVDEQGPPKVAIVIGVVAVVAVLAFGGWLITRDDDDLTTAPAGTEESIGAREPAATGADPAPTASTVGPTAAPTTASIPGGVDPVVPSSDLAPPTSPPPPTAPPTVTAGPPSVLPPASQPPAIAPPSVLPPAVLPPPPDSGATDGLASTVPSSSPPTTPPTGPPGPATTAQAPAASDGAIGAANLVPYVAGEPIFVGDGAQRRSLIEGLLAAPRHDVAAPTPVSMICAAIVLDAGVRLGGRWEVDSRPLASTEPVSVGPPGLGECVDADGDELPAGAYQYVAVDPAGATSAAGTFVAGAERVDQQFSNESGQDVCTILIGPSTARYYEPYRLGGAGIEPGATLAIPLAAVRQDVRTIACDGTELAEFSFDPSAAVQDLTP